MNLGMNLFVELNKKVDRSTIRCMLIFISIDIIFYCVDFAKEHMNSFNVLLIKKIFIKDAQKHLLLKDMQKHLLDMLFDLITYC
jgi:hypothetical protein